MEKKIITISRQFGSGGRKIGEKLSRLLDVPYYDNEIISRAAKESGFAEAAFENAEKKAANSFLYSIAMGLNTFGVQDIGFTGLSIDDRIFLAQSKIIRQVADEGPCVIVGRCSDYVLRDRQDVVNIFICASLDFRIERAIEEYKIPREKAAETILKNDKRRANYYNYHSDDKWGNVNNYHLSLRSDFGGIEHTAKIIYKFLTDAE